MATNYTYKKNLTEKFSIKGDLSNDGTTISYIDGDKTMNEISVATCFAKFVGEPIELTISVKTVQDLEDEFEEDEA